MFKILNGYEHIFRKKLSIKKDNITTRGHDLTLIISVVWISGSYSSHTGQSMNGTN